MSILGAQETSAKQPVREHGNFDRWSSILPFLTLWLIYGIGVLMLDIGHSNFITHVDYRALYSAGVLVRIDPHHLFDISRQNEVQNTYISHGEIPIPFFHPSYEALVYAPFSLLPYQTSFRLFQVFNLLLFLLCFLIGRTYFSATIPIFQPRPGLLFFPFVPLLAVFLGGQDSILALLLLCITFTCLQSGRREWAGAVTALALFKFQFVLVIGMLLASRWGRRFGVAFAITAAALCVVSAVIVGPSGVMQYMGVLGKASLFKDQGSDAQLQMAIHPLAMMNLNALLFAMGTRYLTPQIAFAITALISLCLFAWAMRRMRVSSSSDATAFSIAILCGLLVSGHLYIHDVSLLLLPFALVGARYPRLMFACYCVSAFVFLFENANANFLVSIPLLIFAITLLANREVDEQIPSAAST